MIAFFNSIKIILAKKYNMKNFEEAKMIIGSQIIQNESSMKICQSKFIKDLMYKKRLIESNENVIFIKASSLINMTEIEDYKKVDLYIC